MRERMDKNRTKMQTHCVTFHRTFGVPIQRFMHPLFGFDVVAFDAWLRVPDGVSTRNTIIERYGQEACDMVFSLL